MSPEHTEILDPVRLAHKGMELTGQIEIKDMSRLCQQLSACKGMADYDFQFYQNESKRACISGHIKASLQVICQRCLNEMTLDINAKTNLMVAINIEQLRQVEDNFEPLLYEEPITLQALVEDEIILALPAAPLHPQADCPVKLQVVSEVKEDRKNPFAELKTLDLKKQE